MTRGRFAPSPTGRMHLGNVFCALLSWLSAKSKGGEWVLRIEDLDPQRSREEYALQLMDDLQWLGLPWDGEPVWQSQRGHIYEEYLRCLTEMGLTYPCHCTRADIMATQAPHETDGRVVYKGTCRPRAIDAINSIDSIGSIDAIDAIDAIGSIDSTIRTVPATTRLIVPDRTIPFTDGHYGRHDINLAEHCGDYIVRRKDGAWAYQLAVVVDDALMGITEIVRGRDLLLSSPQQIHLRELLFFERKTENGTDPGSESRSKIYFDYAEQQGGKDREAGLKRKNNSLTAHHSPLTVNFFHHPLLCNAEGQRLCKRDKSMDLGYLRDKGTTAREIIGLLAHLAGLTDTPAPITPTELLPLFSWDKVPNEDIMLDKQIML
ncbi:MAG: glutamyl-Q tRNA(Asp) synthetase [Bacteroidaceae bacterium]|nr:glutamyl-Q tRNA(Asp) synthetase [Bacteroidaceae bacterium]